MMIWWWEHSEKGVTDRWTDGWTDRRTDWTSHIAAWLQLKMRCVAPHNTQLYDCYLIGIHYQTVRGVLYNTVGCLYNILQYCMIHVFHTDLKWLNQNIYQNLNTQETPYILPLWESYGTSIVRILEKIYCVITALHCRRKVLPSELNTHLQNLTHHPWSLYK